MTGLQAARGLLKIEPERKKGTSCFVPNAIPQSLTTPNCLGRQRERLAFLADYCRSRHNRMC
jgi:hypothetical protein